MEALRDRLGGLLLERERLRHSGPHEDLERNRREIVSIQWDLSRALVAAHAP